MPESVRLDDLRILVVEDEFLVAIALEEDLRAAGATVVGPYANLPAALDGAQSQPFDLAVLDVNLNGTMVYPLADHLIARRIPFLFLSGYVAESMPHRFAPLHRLAKPTDPHRLATAILGLVGRQH
jgi:CheY-like chemotaxis protein